MQWDIKLRQCCSNESIFGGTTQGQTQPLYESSVIDTTFHLSCIINIHWNVLHGTLFQHEINGCSLIHTMACILDYSLVHIFWFVESRGSTGPYNFMHPGRMCCFCRGVSSGLSGKIGNRDSPFRYGAIICCLINDNKNSHSNAMADEYSKC